MATALYRRYRPEAFSEMIGQAHVTEPLMTALRTERIGHAYLFSGPRGCGKTTSARILARCLNCAEGPTDTPCGVCPSCVELSRQGGGSLDVVEIDAASHGGVDDARDLRERAVFAPARDRFKIFIIDEAHMVTSGGFNALLKIVEEPPPHVKFIFATTEPEKVIGTIRSRTHHYPFRLIAPATLIEYVQQLCDSEGVEIEPGVLALVVRAGGGSVRDSLSILDQLIAGTESGPVTLERATGLLGYTSSELLDEMVVAMGARDAAAAFAAADRVVQTGQDPRRFVEDLLERFRDLIVVSATTVQGASMVFRGVPDDQLQRMFEQSQAFPRGELSRIADTISEALDRMTGATAPRLHLELMVARALVAQRDTPVTASLASGQAGTAATTSAPASSAPAASAPANRATASATSASATSAASTSVRMPSSATSDAIASGATAAAVTPEHLAPDARREPTAETAATGSGVTGAAPDASTVRGSGDSAKPVAAAAVPTVAEAIDIVATMKSAREFLRSGNNTSGVLPQRPSVGAESVSHEPAQSSSGAMTPETTALGLAAPAASIPTEASASSPAQTPTPPMADPASETHLNPVGFDELLEVWPDLLEEILTEDRDAWNAVSNVQPLRLDADVLTIGVPSRSDLESFKTAGASVLREAIEAAVGITVKYKPAMLPAGTQAAARESSTDAEPSPRTDLDQTAASASPSAVPPVSPHAREAAASSGEAPLQRTQSQQPASAAEADLAQTTAAQSFQPVALAPSSASTEPSTSASAPVTMPNQAMTLSQEVTSNQEVTHAPAESAISGMTAPEANEQVVHRTVQVIPSAAHPESSDVPLADAVRQQVVSTPVRDDADTAVAYDPDFRVEEDDYDDPYAEPSVTRTRTESVVLDREAVAGPPPAISKPESSASEGSGPELFTAVISAPEVQATKAPTAAAPVTDNPGAEGSLPESSPALDPMSETAAWESTGETQTVNTFSTQTEAVTPTAAAVAEAEPSAASIVEATHAASARSSSSVAFAAAPVFETSGTRYGESVVREVLGARFIEERPLLPDRE